MSSQPSQPSEAPEYYALDWRQCPKPEELFEKIHAVLMEFDASSKMPMASARSGKKEFVTDGEDGPQYRQVVSTTTWSYDAGMNEQTAASNMIIVRLWIVAEKVMKKIDARKVEALRAFQYQLRTKEMSEAAIETAVHNLALTIKVHPHSLGVSPMSKGTVFVSPGCKILTQIVHNVWSYAAAGTTNNRTLLGGASYTIPEMISSLQVNQHHTDVRAVVITEHRSTRDRLLLHEADDSGLYEGILWIAPGGFPDVACREFVSLLAHLPGLAHAPFLFMSDCDPHAFAIYSAFKFGSRNQAYASPSMACRRLVFVGLTLEQFKTFTLAYPDRLVENLERDGDMSKNAIERAREVAKDEAQAAIEKVTMRKNRLLSKGDMIRARALLRDGVLDGDNEKVVKDELVRMMKKGPMVSFYDLEKPDPQGVLFYIGQMIADIRDEEEVEAPRLFPEPSEARRQFAAFGKQIRSKAGIARLAHRGA